MAFTPDQTQQLHAQLSEYLGPVVCAALADETVTDIKCSDGWVWLEKHQVGEVKTGEFLPEHRRLLALNTMASLLGKKINNETPSLKGELPLTKDRVQGFVPPTAEPSFYIRRHAPEVFSWEDYRNKGIMTGWQVAIIRQHIHKRSNVVFCGPTGSGKTTLLNTALGDVVRSKEHIVILEDTKEIRCESPNITRQLTSERTSLQQLVIEALRIAPKRLIIGETRDRAGVDILTAWSTGHGGGMTTVHSKGALGVFERFAQFCQQAGMPPLWRLMQSTIDLIVYMEKTETGRQVIDIEEVGHDIATEPIPIALKRLGPSDAMAITLR